MAQGKAQRPLCEAKPRRVDVQFRARAFQQLAIFNAGWTYRLTGATSKTAIDMEPKRIRGARESSFRNCTHKVNASAGAIVLVASRDISRAGFETKAAMNAGE